MEVAPTRKVVVDMAIVDWATKETSCAVLRKQAGRWPRPGDGDGDEDGDDSPLAGTAVGGVGAPSSCSGWLFVGISLPDVELAYWSRVAY